MKTVKNFLMTYIKLCYVYVKFSEPSKASHLQKLANQSVEWRTEMVINSFGES